MHPHASGSADSQAGHSILQNHTKVNSGLLNVQLYHTIYTSICMVMAAKLLFHHLRRTGRWSEDRRFAATRTPLLVERGIGRAWEAATRPAHRLAVRLEERLPKLTENLSLIVHLVPIPVCKVWWRISTRSRSAMVGAVAWRDIWRYQSKAACLAGHYRPKRAPDDLAAG